MIGRLPVPMRALVNMRARFGLRLTAQPEGVSASEQSKTMMSNDESKPLRAPPLAACATSLHSSLFSDVGVDSILRV